ncbi:TIGR00341 family protein [Limibaculum sp. M0105]|uniref:TIGR00341 family protein n=1 Tax=Thermohalobaculum xanthum TaxID=2753746 RepID=A0A8J7SFE5_9RHOB|nr:TIGR00341 family protein [Thermohalobaculum xanthum]MBK0400348.1 TIGR00341 family protein [Thermohalobaculum xanthum]
MAFVWVEIVAPQDQLGALDAAAEEAGASEIVQGPAGPDGRQSLRVLLGEVDRQAFLDRVQSQLNGTEGWRVVLTPTLAVIPRTEDEETREAEEADRRKRHSISASREELYTSISSGAKLDRTYLLLVLLSTVVAAIGLVSSNVAVVIGAMVIAPLLGPHLALSFGIAVGDRQLVMRALRTSAVGLGLAILLSALVPLLVEVDLDHGELAARTTVSYASVALALASGAAASLSVTTGLSTTLVGVMVAVALLPPAATLGISLSEGEWRDLASATMLLAVNIVSVNLAANIVFLAKGIRPHSWWEHESARQSVRLTILALTAALLVLIALIAFSHRTGI